MAIRTFWRRQELIDVASRLFAEKGYEAVSVRDILDVVGGAPGMFYYYFKSKQEIYIATMEQYITERLERKCEVIENPKIPFKEKLQVFRSMVAEDIDGYMERFDPKADTSISDSFYKLWDLVHMLDRMVFGMMRLPVLDGNDGIVDEAAAELIDYAYQVLCTRCHVNGRKKRWYWLKSEKKPVIL